MIRTLFTLALTGFICLLASTVRAADPIAVNDTFVVFANTADSLYVLTQGVPDSDPDFDQISLQGVGTNGINGNSFAGGLIYWNGNGTNSDPTDDFLSYTPPANYTGIDSAYYVITDGTGTDTALVYINIIGDPDLDGLVGTADLDSDNDGVLDIDEDGGTGFDPSDDADADGVINFLDNSDPTPGFPAFVDVNADGVNDLYDHDLDGVADFLDVDSDNDGISDALEANDGVFPTSFSITTSRIMGSDSDNDGLMDDVDLDPAVAYGAGSVSPLSDNDNDGDGQADRVDLDSDNDGLLDVQEAGGADANGDGIIDNFADTNGDGIFDDSNVNFLPIPNSDFAGETGAGWVLRPNYLDIDSDGDGIDDTREGFTTGGYIAPGSIADADGDGISDSFDPDQGGSIATLVDTDFDGTPDYLDTDSDGDGLSDAIEGNDANTDGVADVVPSGLDADNDSFDDSFDGTAGFGGSSNYAYQNQDGDQNADWRDKDDLVSPDHIYYVCDASNELVEIQRFSGTSTIIGGTGRSVIEAIAHWNDVLYATDAGDFGTLNKNTGAFTFIGEVDGGGSANGLAGAQTLNDVDGLSFDPWTGKLWGSNRRSGTYDLLFQIDPLTGLFVPDAFGPNQDYVVVDGSGIYNDVDDISISPVNGQMYTVGNDGSQDQLLQINKYTGGVSVVIGTLAEDDIEGMGYHNDGTFYSTDGNSANFWTIDPTNGNMSDVYATACGDPESVTGFVAPPNRIQGTVWEDLDASQTINGAEVGLVGVTVELWHDADGSGTWSPGDEQLQTILTDANGDYEFLFATIASLVIRIDESTLPSGYALTTDNLETALFQDNVNFNELDVNNDFGAVDGPDCDGDGIPDFAEGGVGIDTDNDGVDNMCDLDSDNDGILDQIEGLGDTDADGIADYLDLDSDNDGIPDAIEANQGTPPTGYDVNDGWIAGTDTDGDGLLDAVDNDPGVAYGAGSSSTSPNPDTDGDGVLDVHDLDSDNDGILDVIEAGGTDADGNGQEDSFTDGNNDGYHDQLNATPLPIPNTDNSAFPDYIDFDSDDDGLDDTLEGMTTPGYDVPTLYLDADGDGIIDFWDNDLGGTPITPTDTDNDGTPDYQDLDSDNDQVPDLIEGNDANGDGVVDFAMANADDDGDGIDNNYDAECALLGSIYSVPRNDYAEEDVTNGDMYLTSSDLELVNDGNDQEVGIHYSNITIPQGATINNAYIQFQTDEVSTGSVTLTFRGHDVNDAPAFSSTDFDVSSRATTTASTSWSPNDWNTVGESGADQQSPALTGIIQEIVNRAGWSSGNDMAIIITGNTTGNPRTAENNPVLFIDYVGSAGNTWGCLTTAPHQDFDGDGIHDWRDTDDDNDNIQTADETGDVDNNGQPDYLETNPCGPGLTEVTVTLTGNADAVQASNNITTPTNALGALDGVETLFATNDNSRVDLDLTDTLPAGTILSIDWRKFSGGGNCQLDIYYSTDGTNFNFIQDMNTTSTSLQTTNVSVPVDARWFRFQRDRRRPAMDGVSYSFVSTICDSDFDQDGIPDSNDEDDDNDGIPDVVEGVGDKDGDGQIDALDRDSDNDGILDAVEANDGVLPANMTTEGHYSAGYVAANDADGDGWADDTDNSTGGTNLPDSDTDNDNIGDRCDLDSDGDCITDAVEANAGVLPANMDDNGQYPAAYAAANDADADGVIDDIDPDNSGLPLANPDTDADGTPNYLDTDADGDGIPDASEGYTVAIVPAGADADGDGLDDACDPESGNNIADLPDLDCNNLMDYLDAVASTAQTGNFTDPNTWSSGTVPGPNQAILINAGHVVSLTGNTQTSTITIDAAGDLIVGTFNLTISGGFNVSGTFTDSTGSVIFAGSSCPQSICGGTIQFNDLTINNSNGVSADCGDIGVCGTVYLTAGTFSTCNANSFTLLACDNTPANVDGTGTGDMPCDVTVQQYKEGCQDGFFGLGMCITSDYEQWNDDVLLTGYAGTPFPLFWNNTYFYDEQYAGDFANGWLSPNATTDVVQRGRGYYIFQGQGGGQLPAIIDVTGTLDFNDFTFPITFTNSGASDVDGYNLLANPYPTAIRWDLSPGNGWTNVGCCDAVYVWDECNGQYASYVDGVGTNGGTEVIATSQAFWVKAHIPGASLTCSREVMLGTEDGEFRSLQNGNPDHQTLYLKLWAGNHSDESAVRLHPAATENEDARYDARKIYTQDVNAPTMFTITQPNGNDTVDFSINSVPDLAADRVVPVFVHTPTSGAFILDVDGLDNFGPNLCIMIEDLQNGLFFHPSQQYTFVNLLTSEAEHRFNIHFKYPVSLSALDVSCEPLSDGKAFVDITGSGPFDVTWEDDMGNVLASHIGLTNPTDSLTNLSSGTYTVHVVDHGAQVCGSFTQTVTVNASSGLISTAEQVIPESCFGDADGAINLAVYGGVTPFTYQWSHGANSQDVDLLSGGNYDVLITDATGCAITHTVNVPDGPNPIANFAPDSDTLNLASGPVMNFTNNSTGAFAWIWNFGDLSPADSSQHASHSYANTGLYTVALEAIHGVCSDVTDHLLVVIDDASSITSPQGNVAFEAYVQQGQLVITADLPGAQDGQLNVHDATGRLVHNFNLQAGHSTTRIPVREWAEGMYVIRISTAQHSARRKIILAR